MDDSGYSITEIDLQLNNPKNNKDIRDILERMRQMYFHNLFEELRYYVAKTGWGRDGEFNLIDFQEDVKEKINQFDSTNQKHVEGLQEQMKTWHQKQFFYIEDSMVKFYQYEPVVIEFKTKGKIVLADSLTEYFDEYDTDEPQTNKENYIARMHHFAKQGLIHGYVGNSCPSFLYSKEKEEIQFDYGYDWSEPDEDGISHPHNKVLPTFEKMDIKNGMIWHYSFVEYDKAIELGIPIDECDVIEITAGTWRLTHEAKITSDEPPYATIKLIKS